MAKVSKEIYQQAQKEKWSPQQVAEKCGVTKQAVCAMFKKYRSESTDKLEEVKPV
jgi:predicted transcriptional regulator